MIYYIFITLDNRGTTEDRAFQDFQLYSCQNILSNKQGDVLQK